MFRTFILSSLIAVGMSSCTVMVLASGPAAHASLTPPAVVSAAR